MERQFSDSKRLTINTAALCLLLTLTSIGHRHKAFLALPLAGRIDGEVRQGFVLIDVSPSSASRSQLWGFSSEKLYDQQGYFYYARQYQGLFGGGRRSVYFPLWYPVLALGLLAVFIHRFSGRFTLRSVLIALTVVAGLLGMAVAL